MTNLTRAKDAALVLAKWKGKGIEWKADCRATGGPKTARMAEEVG
jgi:hypothetical protein